MKIWVTNLTAALHSLFRSRDCPSRPEKFEHRGVYEEPPIWSLQFRRPETPKILDPIERDQRDSAGYTDTGERNLQAERHRASPRYPRGDCRNGKAIPAQGRERTPTLREVARTAPYMHDGSLATLEEVVDFYDRGGNSNPYLDPEMRPGRFTADEKHALLAFLQTLSGDIHEGPR